MNRPDRETGGLFVRIPSGAIEMEGVLHAAGQARALVIFTHGSGSSRFSPRRRPDLAGDALPMVQAPTLLIVGGDDAIVLEMNRDAMTSMTCERRLEIVPGATHLFEEPGALEEVARHAVDWFTRYLAPAGEAQAGGRG
jgi:putative phosphoribosyl transferase